MGSFSTARLIKQQVFFITDLRLASVYPYVKSLTKGGGVICLSPTGMDICENAVILRESPNSLKKLSIDLYRWYFDTIYAPLIVNRQPGGFHKQAMTVFYCEAAMCTDLFGSKMQSDSYLFGCCLLRWLRRN